MPRYSYKCENCGKTFDSVSTIAERNAPKDCECGGKSQRDVATEINTSGDTNATMKNNERDSWALGVQPWQLKEARRIHPGAEFKKTPGGSYVMVIHNRAEKKRRMLERGYEEFN